MNFINKSIILLVLVSSLLLISCDNNSNNVSSCSETDNGLDISLKGTNSGYYNGTFYSSEDYCMANGDLLEYSCDGDKNSDTIVDCQCVDGSCVIDGNDNVEDEKDLSINNEHNISIEEMPTFCQDSESNNTGTSIPEPLIAGYTSGDFGLPPQFEVVEDYCAGEAIQYDEDGEVTARTVLREYYCKDNFVIDREDYTCSDIDPSFLCRIDSSGLGYCG